MLIGFDSVARKIYHLLREPVVGVVSAQPELLPAGARFLGGQQDAEAVLKEYRPTNVLVAMTDWPGRVSPSLLLDCRRSGMTVEESSVFRRI